MSKQVLIVFAASFGTLAELLIIICTPVCSFLKLSPLSMTQFFIALMIAAASVMWYEAIKLINHSKNKK